MLARLRRPAAWSLRVSCDFEANPKKRWRLATFLRPAKRKTLQFLQRNGCESTCGHHGHCDFAMRCLCRQGLDWLFEQGKKWGCSSDSLRYQRKRSATGVLQLHLSRDRRGVLVGSLSGCSNIKSLKRRFSPNSCRLFCRLLHLQGIRSEMRHK